ncbi:Mis12 protein-domain-containing protein [Lipomyces japonicus]|uniref:Mis12 protein-domain-containing protein n=1 Tax=Lipomyces japonicus TaxID=56871 RepID=UPI0034CF05A1
MGSTAQPTASTTALLTEHLEYPPIALIDDIINAVNNILYKCTAAIETFLQTQPPCKDIPDDEIEVGTAKLETLLEGAVDRNFDRFELYVLRNVLAVPDNVADGWMRLGHHKNIDFNVQHDNLNSRLLTLRKTLQASCHVTGKLQQQRRANKELLGLLRTYHSALKFLTLTSGAAPLDETVRFLTSQSDEVYQKYSQARRLENSIKLSPSDSVVSATLAPVSEREVYIEKMTAMIVGSNEHDKVVDADVDMKTNEEVQDLKNAASIIKRLQ